MDARDYEEPMMEEFVKEPKMEEEPKSAADEIREFSTCLMVFSSQDDNMHLLDKIFTSKEWKENEDSKKFNVATTTYEEFLDGKKHDTFDFVALWFTNNMTRDDLEMKQDYYDYYMQVPILHYAYVRDAQNENDLAEVLKYLKEKCDERLFSGDPGVLKNDELKEAKGCADGIIAHLVRLHDRKVELFDGTVKKAFDKFDKDGNGTIDAAELKELSTALGQPLSDEQLESALKDLDLNGDGVIDEKEFCRWYFTGMKAYNGATRSMLQMRNQTSTIFDVLSKDDIQKIIKDDKSMTKHRVKIQFNEPPESYYAELIYHLLGPYTEKMNAETADFAKEIDLKEKAGAKSAKVYATVSIAMKPGQKAKYEEYSKNLMKLFEDNKPAPSEFVPDMYLRLYADDDKLTAKFLLVLPEMLNPLKSVQIPLGLREGLKDVDQYIKMKIVMGADAEEILTQDKPLLEHYLKGFSMTIDVVFLKQIKKALLAGLEGTSIGDQIKEGLTMAGPAFSLETNLSLELDFDDMEEIKAHPMASTVLVSLDQLMQGILGKDRKTVQEWVPDYSEVEDKADFDKFIADSDYCKDKNKQLELLQMVGEMFADFDNDCNLELKAGVFGLASAEYKIEGAGYGELLVLIYKAASLNHRESLVNRMISDYKYSKEQPAADDMPAGEDMEPMML